MKKILLAGATGYLGSHVAKELTKRDYDLSVVARSPEKLAKWGIQVKDLFHADITRPEMLK